MSEILLGLEYTLEIDGKQERIVAVDGEEYFNEPGISHGFVHFVDPSKPDQKKGFCGTAWFKKNARPLT